MSNFKFVDHSKDVLNKYDSNLEKALTAVGQAATEIVLDYMTHKYYRDIHITGDLKRDVNFRPIKMEKKVIIGNSLKYAIPVHEGTSRMKKRPYLKDAITENTDVWKEVFAEYLGSGFGSVST